MKKSILNEADGIVNHRNEEKDREYGPFSEGMDRAASIFNGMSGLDITGKEMYMALIALKLSRESYNHKRDNLLDAVAYIQGFFREFIISRCWRYWSCIFRCS